MNGAPLSQTAEDYLKAIFKLQSEQGKATTSALAERVGVSAPSATAMLKKLAALGLVEHEPYKGVRLTSAGEKSAIEIIRHHRLLEQYLSETLGLPIDELHAEADRLEHVLSEELEARIDQSLGYPTHDPHGDPIPDANLELPAESERALVDLVEGERAVVSRVPDVDTALLRYLSTLSLLPGAHVELVAAAPFGGPVTVLSGGTEHAIARELAAQIGVN
jgi:DtxR family transcriptional regulator, Mn-dependent transcriptional regulator